MGIFLYITPKASVRGCIGMEVPERLNWNDSTCVFHDSILVQIPVQKRRKKVGGWGGGGGYTLQRKLELENFILQGL